MTTATATRSAYPPAIEDLMPQAIALTRSSGGTLPSRNRLMKELHIGSEKAKAVLAELAKLAERDAEVTDLHTAMVGRGSLADRPPLHLVPDPPQDPETNPDATEDTTEFDPVPPGTVAAEDPQVAPVADPGTEITEPAPADPVKAPRRPVAWPVLLLALPAFVAIWSGWVSLGELSGFGLVHPLPGIADHLTINTAITLPIGVETYAAYALWVWLSGLAPATARTFAKWSAIGSLVFGAIGQMTYHLMAAAGMTAAPWSITAAVACLPVAVLGMGAALAHLLHTTEQ